LAFKKKILEEEVNLQPDWNLSSSEVLTEKKCKNKDEEIALSDQIIVASSFTAKSLELFEQNIKSKINIVPYGITCPTKKIINKRNKNDKLKIIFVGRPTLSKGIQYLIQTLDQLDFPWELEIAGSIPEKPHQISQKLDLLLKDSRCKFLGQIQNKNLLKKMRESHIFLFPSLFEGFGQVLLEALSCGLPVITTNNTAGPDIIDDGKNGFLTPIRDTKETIEIINNLYQNEELRISIAENGFTKASEYTWIKYQNELIKIIKTTKI
jgi:glycosyltransferase involved in cell wall biosynthesis